MQEADYTLVSHLNDYLVSELIIHSKIELASFMLKKAQ